MSCPVGRSGKPRRFRPVGHSTVADLPVDRVDEDDRADGVEGSVLPLGHAVHDLAGDGGDGLLGDAGPVDLDLTGRQTPRGRRNHHLVDAGQTLLPLTHDLRLEGAVPVAGDRYLDRSHLGEHGLAAGAVAGVAAVLAGRVVLVMAEVVGEIAFQGGLQQPLGQLRQQPALACQPESLGLGPAHQLVDQLIVHRLRRLQHSRLGGPGLGHVLAVTAARPQLSP
jgi:hypothetical protein